MPDHAELGKLLADARSTQRVIDSAPFDAIVSLEEAYQLQSQAIDSYPSATIGYKVGATNAAVQKLFDCDTPFFGPMFETDQQTPGSGIALRDGIIGGEAEFAFRCSEDFPANEELSIDDLPDLISSCHIAVEIVGRRTRGEGLPSLYSAIADFAVNVSFIEGPAIANWKSTDLAKIQVKATTNGRETNAGTGADVLGHPLNSLLWLHNSLRAKGSCLKAGDRVSTGTCLGVITPVTGSVEIDFIGCGKVGYHLT